MRPMTMILHALKLFFSTGFVSAAAFQIVASVAHWLAERGHDIVLPAFFTHEASLMAVCVTVAAALTLVTELRRVLHHRE